MNRLAATTGRRQARSRRTRAVVRGTSERPRLNVFISQRHITAQIIDDSKHQTLAYVTTVSQKSLPTNLTERANWAGDEIAKLAKTAKVKKVVLDRSNRLYHGRVKALAEAARKSGLEF